MPQERVEELRASDRKSLGLLFDIFVTCYSKVLRFIENVRVKVRIRQHLADEVIVMKAELMWIKDVQLSLVEERRFKEWKHQLQLF
uniref:Uncharacterized protein n=1 Tax=Amphimedon queenslandica TaxID=400682 RepID=A0A1X7UQL1_AMPQE